MRRWSFKAQALVLLVLVLGCVLGPGCGCSSSPLPAAAQGILRACLSRKAIAFAAPSGAPGTVTAPAGTMPATFAVTSTGEATYTMPLVTVPGRAGVEPHLAVAYDGAGDGVLGTGFSIAGLSAITRCPQNLAQDGTIREVRYDPQDKLCLDGKRLVPVATSTGRVEYRTFPDTFVKVVGHFVPRGETSTDDALFFEAFLPSGLIVEYGNADSGKPLTQSGAPQAWLATKAKDGRGNAMSYAYCIDADANDGHAVEYALDEIRYTSFEGLTDQAASRAVAFVYASKDPADSRTRYAGGMALQSSLRLDKIQMLGPGDELVRTYAFTYALGPTTGRTLLRQVAECAGDGACKPPTHFAYTSSAAGFKQLATNIPIPTSTLASPMLFDLDGDGLDDLVLPDTNKSLSTPANPITDWLVARNQGAGAFSAPVLGLSEDWPMVANPTGPADPTQLQPELGTAIDYDQDGLTDVFSHDVWGASPNWIVLLAQPDHTFKKLDTGIPRPFPFGVYPTPPALTSPRASVHLADVNGDGVPDLIECVDHGSPTAPTLSSWTAHLWKPASGATPAGFDPAGESIGPLDSWVCDTELYTLDINADGKVDLVVSGAPAGQQAVQTYYQVTRAEDGTWDAPDTGLPHPLSGGRVVFLDVNGDGLPDAVMSGAVNGVPDTYFNMGPFTDGRGRPGPLFGPTPVQSVYFDGIDMPDAFFNLAVPLDWNGDGRQDLLLPWAPDSKTPPTWVVLKAQEAGPDGYPFTVVDAGIPFDALLTGSGITSADPHGPRVGDLDGDGAPDVVLSVGSVLNVFQHRAPDQDLLASVSDGMNGHDPADPGFMPNVSITYGHLTDASITKGTPAGSPALESDPYLARAGIAPPCAYPVACAVGSRRQVIAYTINNGADQPRHFQVRYRDGRFDRRGRGFLGFAERIVTDRDTGAGTATFYDNTTAQTLGSVTVFPFAYQVAHEQRWVPGLSTQPNPTQIELTFTDVTPTFVPTNGNATYFTLPTAHRVRSYEGAFPNAAAPTIETYVQKVASAGGATALRDTSATVSNYDTFGNVLTEDTSTAGVDLTFHVERTFKNDTKVWVLNQLQTQTECSTAAGMSQCRTLTRHTTALGETLDKATSTDDGIPDTQLRIAYDRDDHGNVVQTTQDDAFGHHRVSKTTYEAEGIYPTTYTNALGQVTQVAYDPRFGTLASLTDPNGLTTTRAYDGFGRLGLETRPDGTPTTVTLSRTKDGGPSKNAWRVTERSTTTGGADDTIEVDSLGRPIRWWWHGPEPSARKRIMQEVAYDALGEHVARRSVPVREDTPESKLLNDLYQYDAMGRAVLHTMPWGATVKTSYAGLVVTVTDPLGNATSSTLDPLGRAATVTDAAGAATTYAYGPFGALHTVTTPGGALTRTTRDAFGRVRQLDDPDRGTTTSQHDGFGELITSTDALGRKVTYEYDGLGRTLSRLDQNGAQNLTTTWTWDTAPNGIGKLASLVSPDGAKTYSYTALGQPQTLTLSVNGESDTLQATLGYDNQGRVSTISYPTPSGAAPFAVSQDYDAFGHVVTVRDSTTSYWTLTDVDDAGRYKSESFGNGTSSTRAYYNDKQSLQSILTQHGTATIQDLFYDYDARRDLKSRSDMGQPQNQTERFRYDTQHRLTCAYFSATENDTAPCALAYAYDPSGNGNLISKSDAGTLAYNDPKHPHAVTNAGSDSFGYDAVGNQTTRPGGASITYTPFGLPKTITQPSGAITLDYDGDEQRIRKTSPDAETLYFEGLYERVTNAAPASVTHTYYIHSPERVVAVVTQPGPMQKTLYVHVDHLGSTDKLTGTGGTVVEQRSYDPFGQRRNTMWGMPPPASFTSLTTVGFTGQENDDELRLVNMKGRMYDPKVGRFLTTDSIVHNALSAQSWNPYSYVWNNPLSFTDPSGFDGADPGPAPDNCPSCAWTSDYGWVRHVTKTDKDGPYSTVVVVKPVERPTAKEAAETGGAVKPVDVSTTGSASGTAPPPVTTAPRDWTAHPALRIAIGIAKASYRFATSISETGTLRGQVHIAVAIAQSAVEGARVDGVLGGVAGGVNTLNPLYALGVAGVETKIGIENGDYERATEGAVTGVFLVGSFFVGGKGGAAEGLAGRSGVPQIGGAHSVVRSTATRAGVGGQSHHMPSWAATRDAGMPGVTHGNAPSIWMETADHFDTPSYASYAEAASYRAQQADLIRNGMYLDALKMDVDAIRALFGDKYDGAIQQMGEYIWRAHE